jgi:protein-disulfide isomerase
MSRFAIGIITLASVVACQKPATTEAKSASGASDAPVAKWNGGSITSAELDAMMFEQRKQALDQLLVRKLVEQKAKAESTTPEALYKREVTDKIKKPAEADMKAFYDEQAKKQPLPPFEQIKDQIAQYMERPAAQAAQTSFVERIKKELNVEIALRPPKIEVAAEGPSKGPAAAPVTIIEFSDFECPYCSKAEETVTQVLKQYGDKVRLVYRDFPLPFHPNAQKAAEAAQCAGDQGKYWEMHEKLFANQKALAVADLKGHAKGLGLDPAKFDKCLDSGDKAKVVGDHRKAGEKVGVTGTPAFFVNGYQLTGAQPIDAFKEIIDQELASVVKK